MSQRGIHKSREVLRIQIDELVGDLETLEMAILKRTQLRGVAEDMALAVVRRPPLPPGTHVLPMAGAARLLQPEAKKERTKQA